MSQMKVIYYPTIFLALLVSGHATASEPIQCYEKAWESRENAGLGLTAGQAVTLCSGATNGKEVIECFIEAWSHPKNGGLGLTAGQAITLCKQNSLP